MSIAFIHSMHSKTNTHGPGCIFMNTGHDTEGFPSSGAWISYALGSENENLPTYVAIPDLEFEQQLQLNLGDSLIQVISFGEAHSPGDISVWLPNEKTPDTHNPYPYLPQVY